MQLLLRLPAQIIELGKAEFANAKGEVKRKAVIIAMAVAFFGLALVIGFWVVATLLTAAIAGLSTVWPVWLSALVVSGAGLLVMVVLVVTGIVIFKRISLVPKDTIERVEDDLEKAKHVGDTASQVLPQPGQKGNWR